MNIIDRLRYDYDLMGHDEIRFRSDKITLMRDDILKICDAFDKLERRINSVSKWSVKKEAEDIYGD